MATEFMDFVNENMVQPIVNTVDYTTVIVGIGAIAVALTLLIIAVMSVKTLLDFMTLNHMKANGVTQIVKYQYPRRKNYKRRYYKKRYRRRY